jgi:uncharacterized protein YjbI with pentapeptide repeats
MQSVIIGLLLLSLSIPACACTCWRPQPDEYLSASTLVFRGTVITVQDGSRTAGMPGAGSVTIRGRQQGKVARFKVTQSIKGPDLGEVDIVYTAADGANCGWSFKEGETATVFATGSSAAYSTSSCMMLPYASLTGRGDTRHLDATEAYRTRRLALAERAKARPTVAAFREQADFFMKYRDHEDAERALSDLLKLEPNSGRALTDRGEVRYRQARFEDALADYRAAVALDGKNADARRGRTLSLVKLGRIEEVEPTDRDFSGFDSGYSKRLDFSGIDLRGAIFRNAKLNGVDFSGSDLRGADFSGANMHTANFTRARLDGAKFDDLRGAYDTSFQQARLAQASFRGARLFRTRLNDAVLDGADFSKAKLESATLEKASLAGANFSGTSMLLTRLQGTRWDGQDLSGADLRGADLRDAVFRNTSLRGAHFGFHPGQSDVMDLRGTDLSGADLADVKWGAALIDCRTRLPAGMSWTTLPVIAAWAQCKGEPPHTAPQPPYEFQRGPRLSKVALPNVRWKDIVLAGFGFWQAQFDGADFTGAKLMGLDIQGGSYVKASFQGADLTRAHLLNASFAGASFENANLSGARLFGLNLREARLTGAQLTGACYDKKTIFPETFDPAAAGAKPCGR